MAGCFFLRLSDRLACPKRGEDVFACVGSLFPRPGFPFGSPFGPPFAFPLFRWRASPARRRRGFPAPRGGRRRRGGFPAPRGRRRGGFPAPGGRRRRGGFPSSSPAVEEVGPPLPLAVEVDDGAPLRKSCQNVAVAFVVARAHVAFARRRSPDPDLFHNGVSEVGGGSPIAEPEVQRSCHGWAGQDLFGRAVKVDALHHVEKPGRNNFVFRSVAFAVLPTVALTRCGAPVAPLRRVVAAGATSARSFWRTSVAHRAVALCVMHACSWDTCAPQHVQKTKTKSPPASCHLGQDRECSKRLGARTLFSR